MKNLNKRCWIDVETSGLDFYKCCILTMGVLIEIDGEIKEELNIKMKPSAEARVDSTALKVNKITLDEMKDWPSNKDGYITLRDAISTYVDRYNKLDKFIFCAYNAHFDDSFVRALFRVNFDKYYGSYFYWPKLDVQTLVAISISNGLTLPNYKLATVCEYYNIEIDAHDALSDIKATRTLYEKMKGEICQ